MTEKCEKCGAEKCGKCGGFFESPGYVMYQAMVGDSLRFKFIPVCPFCGETLYVKVEIKSSEKCWCGADIKYVQIEYCSVCGRTVLECTCKKMVVKHG